MLGFYLFLTAAVTIVCMLTFPTIKELWAGSSFRVIARNAYGDLRVFAKRKWRAICLKHDARDIALISTIGTLAFMCLLLIAITVPDVALAIVVIVGVIFGTLMLVNKWERFVIEECKRHRQDARSSDNE